MLPGDAGHAEWGFTAQGLGVEAAFAGDDQVGTAYGLVKSHQFGDDFHARAELRAEERLGGKPQAAGGAAAGFVAHVLGQDVGAVIGEVAEGSVQLLHLLGVGAFLRAENRRGTVWATQRVIHVSGDIETHLRQTRVGITRQPIGQQWQARIDNALAGPLQVELRAAFEGAVDDYLETCAKIGKAISASAR